MRINTKKIKPYVWVPNYKMPTILIEKLENDVLPQRTNPEALKQLVKALERSQQEQCVLT